MKFLAIDLGPSNIKVNAICLGQVEDEVLEKVIEAEVKSKGMTRDKIYQAYTEVTSMKKLIHPTDIADMLLFLSSSQSRLVSGQVITIDGNPELPDPKF